MMFADALQIITIRAVKRCAAVVKTAHDTVDKRSRQPPQIHSVAQACAARQFLRRWRAGAAKRRAAHVANAGEARPQMSKIQSTFQMPQDPSHADMRKDVVEMRSVTARTRSQQAHARDKMAVPERKEHVAMRGSAIRSAMRRRGADAQRSARRS